MSGRRAWSRHGVVGGRGTGGGGERRRVSRGHVDRFSMGSLIWRCSLLVVFVSYQTLRDF